VLLIDRLDLLQRLPAGAYLHVTHRVASKNTPAL